MGLARKLLPLLGLFLLSFGVYFYLAQTPLHRPSPTHRHGYVICKDQACVDAFNRRKELETAAAARRTTNGTDTPSQRRIMPLNEVGGIGRLKQMGTVGDLPHKMPDVLATTQAPVTPRPTVNLTLAGEIAALAKALVPSSHTLKQDMDKFVIDNKIMVLVVDSGYVNFAINFHTGSLQRIGLKNFLFICIDKDSVVRLKKEGIYCTLYDIGGNKTKKPSDFGTKEYFWKTNVKTAIMLEVLKYGYDVLLCDLDVVLFHNPFPHFNCPTCDVHIQMDKELYNSGFVFARHSPASRTMYQTALNFYLQYHKAHDQAYVNMAIRQLEKEKFPLKLHQLSRKLFPNGHYYFLADHRVFENLPPCTECVIAHNNYLGTVPAKIYRFKENLLWNIDENGYYSNTSTKYMTYENPLDFVDATRDMEVKALKNALTFALLLNRTLILPSFRCCNCLSRKCDHPKHRCSLMYILKVKEFDDAFSGMYREHSFLSYSKVPETIKHSISDTIFLNSSFYNDYMDEATISRDKLKVLNIDNNNIDSTLGYLRSSNESVLKFHSFYEMHNTFQNQILDFSFLGKLKDALQCSLSEQWKESWIETGNGRFG